MRIRGQVQKCSTIFGIRLIGPWGSFRYRILSDAISPLTLVETLVKNKVQVHVRWMSLSLMPIGRCVHRNKRYPQNSGYNPS